MSIMLRSVPVRIAASAVLMAYAGTAGASGETVRAPAKLIETDFALRAPGEVDDNDRWLLPEIADSYERTEPPRLRWRGRKIKLRVPLG